MRRALVFAAAIACGEVSPPPESGVPFNRCSQQSDCEKFQVMGAKCTKDLICTAPGKLSYTLVLSMPTGAHHAPGEKMFLPPQYLNSLFAQQQVPTGPNGCKDQDPRPACQCKAPTCLFLPQNGESQGALRILRSLAVDHWPWEGCGSQLSGTVRDQTCGLRPIDPKTPYTNLPSQFVFRPLWGADYSADIGLVAPDIETKQIFETNMLPWVFSVDEPPGPNNGASVRYDVLLQQAGPADLGVGSYVMRVDPEPPFDSAFPPILEKRTVQGLQNSTEFVAMNMDGFDDKPNVRTFTISTKGPSVAGWHAYLAARSTAAKSFGIPVRDGERISTLATLQGMAGETVVLQTALTSPLGVTIDNVRGMRLVVEPPPDQAIPTFSIDDVDGQILPSNQEYPALPTPVLVSGSVTLDGKGRAARVTFESLHDSNGAIELTDGSLSSVLSYRTVVDTDATGAYSVHLPPGKYGVYPVPVAVDAAKTVIPFVVGSKDLVQQGRALAVNRKTHVSGQVVLGDGRVVGDAEVDFAPALQQPMGTNPLSLPRSVSVHTSTDDGTFGADVDPGVYDITVAPVAGTRFPWIVQTSKTIPQVSDVTLDVVVVPPPIEQGGVVPGLTIRDPSGSAVTGALVDVYAASQVSTTGTPLYLVFRTMTDANGHFDLQLAGAPK